MNNEKIINELFNNNKYNVIKFIKLYQLFRKDTILLNKIGCLCMTKSVRWHIGKDGNAAPCTAKNKCRLGGVVAHGESEAEVHEKYEYSMSEIHKTNLLGASRRSGKINDNQRPRANPEYSDISFNVDPKDIEVPHDPNANYAVLSDVDGTLTKGSLVLDHAIFLHNSKDINLGDLPQKWLNDPKNEKLIVELASKYKDEIKGMDEQDLRVDEFLDNYENNDDRFYSTLNQLKDFKKHGWEVQLISGSPDFLVQNFANRNGFFGKGSDYKKDENGKLNGDVEGMFGADAKHGFIQKLNMSRFKRVLAFGDTVSDKPLFESSHHSTLVDPTEETEAVMKASVIVKN